MSGNTREIQAAQQTAPALAATGIELWPSKIGAGLVAAGISLVALARPRMREAQSDVSGREPLTR